MFFEKCFLYVFLYFPLIQLYFIIFVCVSWTNLGKGLLIQVLKPSKKTFGVISMP